MAVNRKIRGHVTKQVRVEKNQRKTDGNKINKPHVVEGEGREDEKVKSKAGNA